MDVTSSSTVKLQWDSPVDTAAVHSYKVLGFGPFCLMIVIPHSLSFLVKTILSYCGYSKYRVLR